MEEEVKASQGAVSKVYLFFSLSLLLSA